MAYLVLLLGLYYFIVVVLVSPFKSYIQIVVSYFKSLLWTFSSVHACVILGDFCYMIIMWNVKVLIFKITSQHYMRIEPNPLQKDYHVLKLHHHKLLLMLNSYFCLWHFIIWDHDFCMPPLNNVFKSLFGMLKVCCEALVFILDIFCLYWHCRWLVCPSLSGLLIMLSSKIIGMSTQKTYLQTNIFQ